MLFAHAWGVGISKCFLDRGFRNSSLLFKYRMYALIYITVNNYDLSLLANWTLLKNHDKMASFQRKKQIQIKKYFYLAIQNIY